MVAVARTRSALEVIQSIDPSRVAVCVADMEEYASGQTAVDLAIDRFGGLTGIVINHGVIEPVQRIVESNIEEWKRAFDINVFSVVGIVCYYRPPVLQKVLTIHMDQSSASITEKYSWQNHLDIIRSSCEGYVSLGVV